MARQLLLQFSASGQLFAIESMLIIEIIPLVNLTRVPATAEYISGLYNFRGDLIPIIDISMLLFHQPAKEHICTRIIITEIEYGDSRHRAGIIAEQVNQTLVNDTDNINTHNLAGNDAPYIRQIIRHHDNNIQLLDISELLPAKMLQIQQAMNA